MPTGKDIKRTSSQVMELKDLISGPLAATIDADSIATLFELSAGIGFRIIRQGNRQGW